MISQTIGHYRVTEKLGAGGMGEVYRATDSKLGREVALKVLPAAFANDTERMARFQREAQVLASLNHPHIAAIYGFEDSGGVRALVMELVEGPTLADRIAQGPLPLEEAQQIAKQIAEALEFAHERGVIHRDLKPANVKLTAEGAVKLLDFGLAKALEGSPAQRDMSTSPTLTMAATQAGIILGTAAYMSPEQARGKQVDKRTDIWAFGCVMYEMLTGKAAFGGDTVTDVMAAVVTREPDWSALPPGSPTRVLHRCLEKDAKRRLRDIGDAFGEVESVPAAAQAQTPIWRQPVVWVLLLLAIVSSAVALTLWTRRDSTPSGTTRLVIPLPPGQELTDYPAISSDGRLVAYTARQGSDEPLLYLRNLNSFDAVQVSGSRGAAQPFFSPDGQWVAFFARGQLFKAAVAGGAPIQLAGAPTPVGGTWNTDDTIILTSGISSGLLRMPASGGTPEPLTKPDGAAQGLAHTWPQALHGGRSLLFTVWGKGTNGHAVLNLETRQWQLVHPGPGGGIYSPSGHLIVTDGGAGLKAAPFDPAHPVRTTAEASVLDEVYDRMYEPRPWVAISQTGTLVYGPGNPSKRSLVMADRQGNVELLHKEQGPYVEVSLSPDGSKAAVMQSQSLWIYDFQRGTRSRLTFHENTGANFSSPTWSPDGTRVIFASNMNGNWDIYSQPADGSRPATEVLKRPLDQFPTSMALDGTLSFNEANPSTGEDMWILSGDGKASPLRVTQFNEGNGEISPDGRWLAYDSDESGRNEVYLQSYPSGEKRVAVSTAGGFLARWSRDGKELFYLSGDAVIATEVHADGSIGTTRRVVDGFPFIHGWHSYSVSRDGKRFLMIRRDAGSIPRQLNVILNWSEELKNAALPGKK